MDSKFLLYLDIKKFYQARISFEGSEINTKLIQYFYDKTHRTWVKSNDILELPLKIWPALSDYIPTIDQLIIAIQDNSICLPSNCGMIFIF